MLKENKSLGGGLTAIKSMRGRILLSITILFIIILFVVVLLNYYRMKNSILENEKNYYTLVADTVYSSMDTQLKQAKIATQLILNNGEVVKSFAERDRETLHTLVQPIFKDLKQTGINLLQFHILPAVSFYRAHQPDKFGDDLSSFRATVLKCNQEQAPVEGLEEGRGGFGFRVVYPVVFQNKHVGSVECGSDFANDYLKELKKNIPGEYFIYRTQQNNSQVAWNNFGGGKNLFAGTIQKDSFVIAQNVVNSAVQSGQMRFGYTPDQRYGVLIMPVRDYSGQVKGVIKGVINREASLNKLAALVRLALVVLAVGIAVVFLTLFLLVSFFTKPLNRMAYKLWEISYNIKRSMEEMSSANDNVIASGTAVAGAASESYQHVESVNGSVMEMKNFVQNIVNSAKTTDEQVSRMHEQVSDGQSIVNSVSGTIGEVTETSIAIERLVHDLESKSQQIEQILSIIRGIAEQTNLLALNASIEAARAGEAGRSFTVVAQEVGKLAVHSTDAVKQITSLITGMQSSIRDVVPFINRGTEGMRGVLSEFTRVEDIFALVYRAAEESTLETNNIVKITSALLAEVSKVHSSTAILLTGAQESAKSSENIAATTQEQGAYIQQFLETSQVLLEMSNNLYRLVTGKDKKSMVS